MTALCIVTPILMFLSYKLGQTDTIIKILDNIYDSSNGIDEKSGEFISGFLYLGDRIANQCDDVDWFDKIVLKILGYR